MEVKQVITFSKGKVKVMLSGAYNTRYTVTVYRDTIEITSFPNRKEAMKEIRRLKKLYKVKK